MGKIYFRNKSVNGIFRLEKMKGGQQGKRLRLCSIVDYEFKTLENGEKRARTPKEKAKFIDKLYNLKLKELLLDKEKTQASGLLVKQLMDAWLEYVKIKNSEITENRYRTTVEYYLKAVGNHHIEDYNYKKYLTFLSHLKNRQHRGKSLSDQRIRTHFRQLRVFYNWAFKQRIIERSFYIELPDADQSDPVPYRSNDLLLLKDTILSSIKTTKRRDHRKNRINDLRALILAPYLGWRRGAVWSLKLENIHLETGIVKTVNGMVDISPTKQVPWKNKKRKQIEKPIPDALLQFLRKDLANREPDERYYLDSGFGYTCYRSPHGLTKSFSAHRIAAGLPDEIKPFHGIRAGCVNNMIASKTNPSVIKDYFDHSSYATSDGYSAEEITLMKEAADLIQIGWESEIISL